MLKGQIIKNISNHYLVKTDNGSYECVPRGKFRAQKKTPLVGDYCEIDEKNNYILELLPRLNELSRPSVCNVNYGLIVTSMKQPDFNFLLLDKEITYIILANIKPVICFTKLDLLEDISLYETVKKYYESIGIPCFRNNDLEALKNYLANSLVVLTGQTGAGKSTLLNKLDKNLSLKTGEISQALNRGKHTTRHTEIFTVDSISFCDTPGFSALDILDFSKEDVKNAFLEFQKYSCEFKDCFHLKERNCRVKEAVENGDILPSRYQSYVHILENLPKNRY